MNRILTADHTARDLSLRVTPHQGLPLRELHGRRLVLALDAMPHLSKIGFCAAILSVGLCRPNA